MTKMKLFVFSGLICLFLASAVLAGTMYEMSCKNKNCNYKAQVNIGGGFMTDQITGYCLKENKFVYLTWGRQGPPAPPWFKGQPAPEPIKIWNPATGETLSFYKCPTCADPFLPIRTIEELKHCPKCKQATVEHKAVGAYD